MNEAFLVLSLSLIVYIFLVRPNHLHINGMIQANCVIKDMKKSYRVSSMVEESCGSNNQSCYHGDDIMNTTGLAQCVQVESIPAHYNPIYKQLLGNDSFYDIGDIDSNHHIPALCLSTHTKNTFCCARYKPRVECTTIYYNTDKDNNKADAHNHQSVETCGQVKDVEIGIHVTQQRLKASMSLSYGVGRMDVNESTDRQTIECTTWFCENEWNQRIKTHNTSLCYIFPDGTVQTGPRDLWSIWRLWVVFGILFASGTLLVFL